MFLCALIRHVLDIKRYYYGLVIKNPVLYFLRLENETDRKGCAGGEQSAGWKALTLPRPEQNTGANVKFSELATPDSFGGKRVIIFLPSSKSPPLITEPL
ncbi:hypothetical protein AGOR_G00157760 [Albula goreensis]|uniref:Uncharacterized protein n=1 Tax=Albula goreensis TaxID=1534307 RepID=A0A8T3D2R1_9TELE|nr:hypothetical protein AGOR_G00157760 [Albula goreensis]